MRRLFRRGHRTICLGSFECPNVAALCVPGFASGASVAESGCLDVDISNYFAGRD